MEINEKQMAKMLKVLVMLRKLKSSQKRRISVKILCGDISAC